MGTGANISLIVSALDLSLVRLLRDAIRVADLSARAGGGGGGARVTPADRFEPRPHIHPDPTVDLCKRVSPACPNVSIPPDPLRPRVVGCYATALEKRVSPSAGAPLEPERRGGSKSPIQPPWKVLPWQNPPATLIRIKVAARIPDISPKGSLLDCFI